MDGGQSHFLSAAPPSPGLEKPWCIQAFLLGVQISRLCCLSGEAEASLGWMGLYEGSNSHVARARVMAGGPGRVQGQYPLGNEKGSEERLPLRPAGSFPLASQPPGTLASRWALPTHCLKSVQWERGGRTLAFPVLVHSCPRPLCYLQRSQQRLRVGRGRESSHSPLQS